MITTMRGCVAYNDLWPWPISSRSFCLDLENRVLSVASTVLDGFFPYLVQMITSMRRCVACDDPWPWPTSSRSFSLDLENRVLSVASTVLDGFFPYLVQMITSMRRCVACDDLWPWPISSRSFDLDFENRVCSVTFSVLDLLFFWLGIQYVSKVWVIMRRRGVSSERRRSSCSSSYWVINRISGPAIMLYHGLPKWKNVLIHWGWNKMATIFPNNIFKCILLNENVWISLKISLPFAPKILINNISALVQIMAWHWPRYKPVSEPMMVNLLTHICLTWLQWVNNRNLWEFPWISIWINRVELLAGNN